MNRIYLTAAFLGGAVLGCGSNSGEFTPWVLEDLKGGSGFSLRVPHFEVPAGHESQNCYFVKVPDINGNGQDVWIDRVLTAINPGSHHVNVFRVKTIIGLDPAAGTPATLGDYSATVVEGADDYQHSPCWASANWADWPLIANSQHASIEELKEENRALRQRHETLTNDRAGLLQKNEQVRARVEAMIGRLKTMEHGA